MKKRVGEWESGGGAGEKEEQEKEGAARQSSLEATIVAPVVASLSPNAHVSILIRHTATEAAGSLTIRRHGLAPETGRWLVKVAA